MLPISYQKSISTDNYDKQAARLLDIIWHANWITGFIRKNESLQRAYFDGELFFEVASFEV